jgi:CBS-domain-containing membrane protein
MTPVVDYGNRLIGMVTGRDLTVRSTGRGMDPRQARVDTCMTHGPFACHAKDCMRQMSRHQVRRQPIINDQNQVIGIVSQADLAPLHWRLSRARWTACDR